MIASSKTSNAHLASTWTAGVAALFLGIGLTGAVTPLLPESAAARPQKAEVRDLVMVEEYEAPPSAVPAVESAEASHDRPPAAEMEIPEVPQMTSLLTPPEMTEIIPLSAVKARSRVASAVAAIKPPLAKSGSSPNRRSPVLPGSPSDKPGLVPIAEGQSRDSGRPSLFSGVGTGRFPQPSYPSAARRASLQGSVRLSVTVETSGLPSSVSIASSSGHSALDTAARDQVQRRWRWPVGAIRRFIIPIRFVLQ